VSVQEQSLSAGSAGAPDSARAQLSSLDRLLPVWIIAAMVVGILIGRAFPGFGDALDRVKIENVSLPIAIGLFWMMYPVLAKVRYESLGRFRGEYRLFGISILLNWVLGPLLMVGLAWLFLPNHPEYRNGLILIGLARCIAMVLIWNMLAKGDGDIAAVLVALNSLFQIAMYSLLGWFFLTELPTWFGQESTVVDISVMSIARNVAIFLGVPLVAGYLTRRWLVAKRGEGWYDGTFVPRISPFALIGLLYTIVLIFAMQGDRVLDQPFDVVRIALPLLAYFLIMFSVAFLISKRLGFDYPTTASLSFTAAGNNFELAIAVSIGLFGIASGEALAGVVGPLIEVPVLIALVYLSLWMKDRYFPVAPVADAALVGMRD
jgi:ACR3 family arsenite transporter